MKSYASCERPLDDIRALGRALEALTRRIEQAPLMELTEADTYLINRARIALRRPGVVEALTR